MCFKIYFIFVHVFVCRHVRASTHIHMSVCTHVYFRCMYTWLQVSQKVRDGIRFPGAEVAGNFELPNGVSIGNWTPVLWKGRVFSLIHWAISPAPLRYICLNKLQTYCMACFVCIILKLQTSLKHGLTTRLPKHSLFIFLFLLCIHIFFV